MKKNILPIVLLTLIMFSFAFAGNQNSQTEIIVKTLIENTRLNDRDDLTSEHGVSMHIKFGDTNILFDTGSSGNFITNAAKLNVDIREVDILVISHAHRDHGGGLNHFFKVNSKAKIYMHENSKKDYFYKDHNIGLDTELLSKFKNRSVSYKTGRITVFYLKPQDALRSFNRTGATFRYRRGYLPLSYSEVKKSLRFYTEQYKSDNAGYPVTYHVLYFVVGA